MKNRLKKQFKNYIHNLFLYLKKNRFYIWIKKSNIFYRAFISTFLIVYWIIAFIMPFIPFWIITLFLWFILIYEPNYVKSKFFYIVYKTKIKYYLAKLYFKYKIFKHYSDKK